MGNNPKILSLGALLWTLLSTAAIAQDNSVCAKSTDVQRDLNKLLATIEAVEGALVENPSLETTLKNLTRSVNQIAAQTNHHDLATVSVNIEKAWSLKDKQALTSGLASVKARLAVVQAEAGCE